MKVKKEKKLYKQAKKLVKKIKKHGKDGEKLLKEIMKLLEPAKSNSKAKAHPKKGISNSERLTSVKQPEVGIKSQT